MAYYFLGYALVPVAFVIMVREYRTTNWIWLGLLIGSLFLGIAPFMAIAYLGTAYFQSRKVPTNSSAQAGSSVTYHPDGSYTVYKAVDPVTAPSPGRLAFRIIGGIIAGASMAFGLLVIGVILLFTLAPSVACGGSSKCY